MNGGPSVSVVIPCRNEVRHIEKCVRSVLRQHPPEGGFEIIVADGLSEDGTREILVRLANEDRRLRMINNPQRITPSAMNAGIREARGRYVAIMGAHTEYAPSYLRICVELLETHPEAWCTGGPIISRGQSPFGQAVALAMSHPAGVGNAKHRFPEYEGYAEGACFPVFRREVFDTVGLYDESLARNQDDDLNYRIAIAGGKVFISPRAGCAYFVRDAPLAFFRQYFDYGYWRVAVLRKHRFPASLRQMIPIVFFGLVFVLFPTTFWLSGWWRLVGTSLPLAYATVLGGVAAHVAMKSGVRIGLLFGIAAAVMHFAYAAGFGWAIIRPYREGYSA